MLALVGIEASVGSDGDLDSSLLLLVQRNCEQTGFFINVNDASVIDSDGKRDLKAFKASLKENTLGELSDEDMEGLFESLINIASESLTMFLTEDSSPAPNEKSAK